MSTFTVAGADTVAATMRRAADDLADTREANTAAARVLAGAARTRAPRRTGALSASVRVRSVTASSASVTATARHGRPLNYGVGPRPGLPGPHNITATRFLTGAYPTVATRVRRIYTDAARTAVARIHGARA